MNVQVLHRQLVLFRRDWTLNEMQGLLRVLGKDSEGSQNMMRLALQAAIFERCPEETRGIGDYPVKTAEILRSAPLHKDPYHQAIKQAAQNLHTQGFPTARYLSQNASNATLWNLGDGRTGRIDSEGNLNI